MTDSIVSVKNTENKTKLIHSFSERTFISSRRYEARVVTVNLESTVPDYFSPIVLGSISFAVAKYCFGCAVCFLLLSCACVTSKGEIEHAMPEASQVCNG
ncbi:hypothetical protein AVEN_220929-1 [Araneus ventricosus]|uniref:Uncharacterized protein n=1 Tax=Araneus ventricosus TaxID=182803 RepID=A0A4Y2USR2_ARAVE|nr:hypothetical protein AVEN_220929-1 [Araneus ventricosus]